MSKTIDISKLNELQTVNDHLNEKYGQSGTLTRNEFKAKARAWYYAECLKEARIKSGLTQQEVADRIGKKRSYISLIERGETDMQLSTFILLSEAVGLRIALTE